MKMTAGMRTVSRLRAQRIKDDKADAGHKDSKMLRMEKLRMWRSLQWHSNQHYSHKEFLPRLKSQLVNKILA